MARRLFSAARSAGCSHAVDEIWVRTLRSAMSLGTRDWGQGTRRTEDFEAEPVFHAYAISAPEVSALCSKVRRGMSVSQPGIRTVRTGSESVRSLSMPWALKGFKLTLTPFVSIDSLERLIEVRD